MDFVGRSLLIGGKPYTVISKADWGNYYYLSSPEDDPEVTPMIRPIGVIHRAVELGAEIELSDYV